MMLNNLTFESENIRPKQLSFQSEKLEIDYITLNVSIKGDIDPESIARFLYLKGFNSTFQESEQSAPENLLWNKLNKYNVILVKHERNPKKEIFWNGLAVRFPGSSGKFFYHLLKEKLIKFELFPEQNIKLGRLDLHYYEDFPTLKLSKRVDIKNFLYNCKEKYKNLYPLYFAKISDTQSGLILRAGKYFKRLNLKIVA